MHFFAPFCTDCCDRNRNVPFSDYNIIHKRFRFRCHYFCISSAIVRGVRGAQITSCPAEAVHERCETNLKNMDFSSFFRFCIIFLFTFLPDLGVYVSISVVYMLVRFYTVLLRFSVLSPYCSQAQRTCASRSRRTSSRSTPWRASCSPTPAARRTRSRRASPTAP